MPVNPVSGAPTSLSRRSLFSFAVLTVVHPSQHNILDASGGALNRAAKSTQPLDGFLESPDGP